jgi:hypothetical protein
VTRQIGEGAWDSINYSGEVLAGEKWYGLTRSVASGIVLHSVAGRLYVVFLYAFAAISMTPQLSAGASLAVVLGYDEEHRLA